MTKAPILEFDASANQIVVTPDNPLVINETNVELDDVVIMGGVISAAVETDVTFKKLSKVS